MKYKAGDKLVFKDYASRYVPCVVGKVLEKTNRYRIQYTSTWSGTNRTEERLEYESNLFLNPTDGINSEIEQSMLQIGRLQTKIIELNNQKTKVTEVKEQGVVITETPKPEVGPIMACDPEDRKPEYTNKDEITKRMSSEIKPTAEAKAIHQDKDVN